MAGVQTSCPGEEALADQLSCARAQGGAYLLPPRLLVRISGPDAFRYLNGQVTRDLLRLQEGHALAACLLTAKGKLCATVLIRREGSELLLEADPSLKSALIERLERYIVADDVTVTLEPDRDALHLFGSVAGIGHWSEMPASRVERLGVAGRDLEVSALDTSGLPPLLDPLVVEVLRIERGIPAWGNELRGEILPPEAGLDRSHIDYDRGCYPGQELISRLKSIGKVNRLLKVLKSPPGFPLARGMTLVDGNGVEIGCLESAGKQYDFGSFVGLGYLPRVFSGEVFSLDPLTGAMTPLSIAADNGS